MKKEKYSQQDYEEDLKLILSVLKKFNTSFIEDTEQFVIDCLLRLYNSRQNFDLSKGKYSTYAYRVITNFYINYLQKKISSFGSVSFDEPFKENMTLADFIGTELFIEELGVVDEIKDILFSKKEIYRKIIKYILLGYTQREIAQKLKITHQYCSYIKKQFQNELRSRLLKKGYEV